MSDTFYQIIGCIGFAVMIAAIIVGSRVVTRFRNRATARALASLAASIGGEVDARDPNANPSIVATFEGQMLRAHHSPKRVTSAVRCRTGFNIDLGQGIHYGEPEMT